MWRYTYRLEEEELRRLVCVCAEEEGREGGAEWEISVGESGSELVAGVAPRQHDASQEAMGEADHEVGEPPGTPPNRSHSVKPFPPARAQPRDSFRV